MPEAWARFESDVRTLLELDRPPGSGNQWHDPSDGTTRNAYGGYPVVMDAKYTGRKSFSVTRQFLEHWLSVADALGKHFLLPIRFRAPSGTHRDFVLVPLDDYAELLIKAREAGIR